MKKMEMNTKETKDFFVEAFRAGNLVPILGSGFSCGMKARKGNRVPNGSQLKEYMVDKIIKKWEKENKKVEHSQLMKKDFSWISDQFFKTDLNEISNYFYDNFTGIQFHEINKKRFLNEIKWQYIYTLNVDTAIESSSDNWEVFYPNKDFLDKSVFDKKKLYKIHGDINSFCKSKNLDDLIFSETQYLNSFETNTKFHNMLAADCNGKNLLYIGCSLDDEIDIKFSVISDANRNSNPLSTRRIYVTTDNIESDPIKMVELESFQITHFIKLNNINDYDNFYEFITICYEESLRGAKNPNDYYFVKNIKTLDINRDDNLQFLLDSTNKKKLLKPYYFTEKEEMNFNELGVDNIFIFSGRRFSGKTMFAYNILEQFVDRKRYFISTDETISDENIISLLNEQNILVVFDADAISEEQLYLIHDNFLKQKNKTNIICILLNSFDEKLNIISYFEHMKMFDLNFKGKLTDEECNRINQKLNEMGILIFDKNQTILDNTIRIANKVEKQYQNQYTIEDKKELILLIWLAVKKKMYLQELIALRLLDSYMDKVKKFSPILQIEKSHIGENFQHSTIKVIVNAPIALLQILNNYAYPECTPTGEEIRKRHFNDICSAIYDILILNKQKNDKDVKRFLMFDTLNDIFSKQYSKENIGKIIAGIPHTEYGAAGLIQAIYENDAIQKLKSDEPNYWLQRAKSLYILNMGKKGKEARIKEGIEWAKKAEGDSETLINNGKDKYKRTQSNAIVQIAMLYGNLASKMNYKNKQINSSAIIYYYKALSDENNMQAAKSLIERSKGTKDFKELLSRAKLDKYCIYSEYYDYLNYLFEIPEYSNGIKFRI